MHNVFPLPVPAATCTTGSHVIRHNISSKWGTTLSPFIQGGVGKFTTCPSNHCFDSASLGSVDWVTGEEENKEKEEEEEEEEEGEEEEKSSNWNRFTY